MSGHHSQFGRFAGRRASAAKMDRLARLQRGRDVLKTMRNEIVQGRTGVVGRHGAALDDLAAAAMESAIAADAENAAIGKADAEAQTRMVERMAERMIAMSRDTLRKGGRR